jgi:hypothetical protein
MEDPDLRAFNDIEDNFFENLQKEQRRIKIEASIVKFGAIAVLVVDLVLINNRYELSSRAAELLGGQMDFLGSIGDYINNLLEPGWYGRQA